eukprot:Rhum_TRINITY_DN14989_c1_g1::Rhum_TRINITY_DN14989_c1_g1_i4::g.130807::m.130807
MRSLPTMFVPLLALALATAAAAEANPSGLASRESFPADFQSELVATLSTTLTVTAVAALAALVLGCVRGIRLPTVLMLCMWSGLLVVGIVAWVVTYVTSRDVIEDTKERLLTESAGAAIRSVRQDLEAGVLITEMVQRHVRAALLDVNASWPVPHLYLNQIMRTVATSAHPALLMLYIGTSEGRLHGVQPQSPDIDLHYAGARINTPSDNIPPWVVCPSADRADAADCKAHVAAGNCSSGTSLDRLCLESCSVPGPSRANCYVGSPGLLLFHAVNNDGVGDFGEPTEKDKALNIYHTFDPRGRPWYPAADTAVWVDPYKFVGDSLGAGITVSARVYDTANVRIGTVGADYNLASMNVYLRDMAARITPNTITIVVTLDWIVVGASLDDAALQADSGVMDLKDLLNVTKFTNPKSRISRMFGVVTQRFQSLEGAMGGSAMLQESGDVVMSYPIEVRGGLRLLMGVMLPYDDVMGKANDASLMALLLAVAISVVCALLTMGAITVLLRPLRQLQGDMIDVAEMRLDGHNEAKPPCTLLEMREMQAAFLQMVVNLVEYRQYLPQSVLCESETADEDGTSVSGLSHAGGTPRASSKGSSRSRGIRIGGMSFVSGDGSSLASRDAKEKHKARETAFAAGLRSRHVTVLLVNVKDFAFRARTLDSDDLVALHEHYVETIMTVTRGLRGMVDEFVGDHVGVSFNTVLTTTVHKFKAVECAVQLGITFSQTPVPVLMGAGGDGHLKINTALATGRALLGNMGCSSMKKYTIVAKAAVLVRLLERWGARWGVGCLTDGVIGADVSVSYVTRKVTKMAANERTQMLYEIVGTRADGNYEWMYRIERHDEENPFSSFNKAVDALYDGRFQTAADHLDKCPDTLHLWANRLRKLVGACEERNTPPAPLEAFSVPSLEVPPPSNVTATP